jgi:hypothetical protein
LKENEWINFVLPDKLTSYRYYRIFINSPEFISMGGLRLYGDAGVNGATPLPEPSQVPVVRGRQDAVISGNTKIFFNIFLVTVSNSQGYNNRQGLFSLNSYWHVAMPKQSSEAWVRVDLETPIKLAAITVKPRKDFLGQMWHGTAAVLQGSQDMEDWTPEVALDLKHDELAENKPITFLLPESVQPYRYYRIFISDTAFYSMAGLELFR